MNLVLRLTVRLYQAMLRLYPLAFRQELGMEMQDVFARAAADARRKGLLSLVSLFWRELRDLPANLVEVSSNQSQGGIPMKIPNYSRWFGEKSLTPDKVAPRPWGEIWLGVAFFILVLSSFTSYYWSQFLPFEKTLAIKIGNIFTLVGLLILLGFVILGGIKKFPDWSLPYVGFVIALLAMIILILTNPNRVELWMAVVFFISPMFLLILAKWLRPIHSLWKKIWEDPTRLGWLYTGVISLALLIVLDDQKGEYLYKTITFLWFIPAAIFYLRSRRLWLRIFVPPLLFLITWMEAIPMTYGIFNQPFAESWDHGVGMMVRIGMLILLWLLVPGIWILLRRVKWITPTEV